MRQNQLLAAVLLRHAHISQQTVADAAGCTQARVSQVLSGAGGSSPAIRAEIIKRLAGFTGNPDDLFKLCSPAQRDGLLVGGAR